ncbi:MAG: hypothetical protein ACO1SV_10705 [Fimbriimonas sp.]
MTDRGVLLVFATVVASFIGAAFWGAPALVGMAVAWTAGGMGAIASVLMAGMVGRLMASEASPKLGTFIVVLGAFVKFPILIAAWWVVRRQGVVVEGSFIAGIVLVYFALVGWAATRNAANP